MKSFSTFLAVVTLACSATSALAASYSIEGQITSSAVALFPEGATYRYSFDYDASTVGVDAEPSTAVESYENALTNATLVIDSPTGSTTYTLFNTRIMVVRSTADHQLYLEFFGMAPAVGDPAFVYGLAAYYGDTDIWTSSAPPADLSSQPWIGGEFWMEFEDSLGASYEVGGTTELPALVPEPSAVLLGAVGALGLLRRRR